LERIYELESLDALSPSSPPRAAGLDLEQAMALIEELQDAERRLRQLRDGIERVLAEDEGRDGHPLRVTKRSFPLTAGHKEFHRITFSIRRSVPIQHTLRHAINRSLAEVRGGRRRKNAEQSTDSWPNGSAGTDSMVTQGPLAGTSSESFGWAGKPGVRQCPTCTAAAMRKGWHHRGAFLVTASRGGSMKLLRWPWRRKRTADEEAYDIIVRQIVRCEHVWTSQTADGPSRCSKCGIDKPEADVLGL
jgi:hypothetical protein